MVLLRALEAGDVQLTASAAATNALVAQATAEAATSTVDDEYIEVVQTIIPMCGPLGFMPVVLLVSLIGMKRRWR